MRKHITRFFIASLLLIGVGNVSTSYAQVPDEARRIEVSPKSLNCYGHWEGPVVVLERFGNEVFANGWRIHRLLPANPPSNRPKKVETRPWPLLEQSVWKLRNQLTKEGLSFDDVVDSCLVRLQASPIVVSAKRDAGTCIDVAYQNESGKVKKGSLEFFVYRLDPAEKVRRELKDAKAFFNRIATSLENGDLVIIASHVMGETIQIPASNRGSREVQEALAAVETSKAAIDSADWEYNSVFSSRTAEQIRHPMPITRKERR